MSSKTETQREIERLNKYEAGFVTDIESDKAPKARFSVAALFRKP